MLITVKFFATLRLALPVPSVEIRTEKPTPVLHLIDLVCAALKQDIRPKLLEQGAIRKGTILLVNGKNVLHLQGLDTVVGDGDEVVIFPPAGGG